jgi:hypothetical protein
MFGGGSISNMFPLNRGQSNIPSATASPAGAVPAYGTGQPMPNALPSAGTPAGGYSAAPQPPPNAFPPAGAPPNAFPPAGAYGGQPGALAPAPPPAPNAFPPAGALPPGTLALPLGGQQQHPLWEWQ